MESLQDKRKITTGQPAALDISFSIVTVTRNAAEHIAACLQSVSKQTHPDVEHIIVDGASTDDTAAIVERVGRAVKFVSEPDDGIYDAMNKGVGKASGDYILILGADDYLVDDKVLADAADYIRREGLPHLVYGDLEVRHGNGDRVVFSPPPVKDVLDFLIYGCLPHQSMFAHRELFERIGLFDTQYRVHGDYEWSLRAMTAESVEIRYMRRIIGSFFSGGTSSRLEKSQEELYRIQNGFGLYQQPEWMERRLLKFQQQTLAYRLQLEAASLKSPFSIMRELLRRAQNYAIARAKAWLPR